ncbi:MAG: hypothetical protein Q7T38_09885 [Gallionella sp.]|nr:hypothetical protein [Gallionella sp.]
MKFAPFAACRQDFPGTEQLLISGGDARIAIDPVSGLNKYGCKPYPDPALLAFGSSTASTISEAAFAAANQLRDRLLKDSGAASFEAIYAREMQRIRRELLELVSDLDIELAFASSGTDAHFLAARYAASASDHQLTDMANTSPQIMESAIPVPLSSTLSRKRAREQTNRYASSNLTVVMVEEDETGSGVAAALSAADADGRKLCRIELVPLRAAEGAPRPLADIDRDVTARVIEAVALGERVLLIMVDQSKTGLIAPSPACVMQLHQRHPGLVEVLVDACQFRIAPPTLRAYLQQGFMVALTGSKFLTGPSFSAALLYPGVHGTLVRAGGDFGEVNFGLLLRWEAALAELRRFRAVPDALIIRYLEAFALAVQQRLIGDLCFEPLAVPPLDRSSLLEVQSWDHIQTIFPFLLYHSTAAGRVPLERSETLQIYRQLQQSRIQQSGSADDSVTGLRCQFGQPVACGTRDGVAVSALRLCISARQISDAAEQNGIAGLIDDALTALDKTAGLICLAACR